MFCTRHLAGIPLFWVGLVLMGACTPNSATADHKESAMPLSIGDPAPEFALSTHEGKKSTLADFRGKRLLIWFYPKASTGG